MRRKDKTIQRNEIANSQQYTVHEAAPLLEMSANVLRKRAARGPLNEERDPHSAMHIRSSNPTATKHGATSNATATSPSELVGNLRSYIESLKSELAARNEELRRREEEHREQSLREDHLLAETSGRAPGLQVPSLEPRNACEGHGEPPQRTEPTPPMTARGPHTSVRRPWWLRVLGG